MIGSKMGLDATIERLTKGHLREWPADINMSKEIVEMVTARWSEYEFD